MAKNRLSRNAQKFLTLLPITPKDDIETIKRKELENQLRLQKEINKELLKTLEIVRLLTKCADAALNRKDE